MKWNFKHFPALENNKEIIQWLQIGNYNTGQFKYKSDICKIGLLNGHYIVWKRATSYEATFYLTSSKYASSSVSKIVIKNWW